MKQSLYKDRFFHGVNYDYIIALKYDDNDIERCEIPINKDEWLIDDIYSMVDDDMYEVDDIYNAFNRRYKDCGDFDYCLGHKSLTDHHIDAISYPSFDVTRYREQARIYTDRIKSAKSDASKEWNQKEFNKWSFLQKKEYLNKCLPYVFACNYHDALIKNDIKNNYFIYSNEKHGRFLKYDIKITEDIEIDIKTNFCFGSSSSFAVTITYKGIPIIPYSTWIRFYYAGFNEIITYTRSYFPDRKNWENCMDFVVWFVRKALENPEGFVKETIFDEVKNLMNGIEEVFNLSDEKMKYYMTFSNEDKEINDKYYIGITAHEADNKEMKYYSIAPEEVKFVFRMEKITGALLFIKSLRELREIDCDFEQVINRIKEINELIYPELLNAIPPVREYIAELQSNLAALEKRFDVVKKRYESYEDRLNKKLDKIIDKDKRKEAEESFVKFNPQYIKYKDEYIDLLIRIRELKERIENRGSYLKKLEDAKSRILRHVGVDHL